MTTTSQGMERPRTTVGPLRWLRRNLFNTWVNSALTMVLLYIVVRVALGLGRWVFAEARWGVVSENLKLFMVGRFPPDQVWRVGVSVLIISFFFGLSWGAWGGLMRSFAVVLAAVYGTLAILPLDLPVRLWLVGNLALVVAGALLVRFVPFRRWKSAIMVGWLLSFVPIFILLRGVSGVAGLPLVDTNLWGGLLLSLMLTIIGIVVSMPMGILLALGRRSELPAVRVFSVGFIEIVRGVPMVTLLFFASIMLPLFLPENVRIPLMWRIAIVIVLFSAAYNAENVRGGLQAVPQGQVEAAKALGMKGWTITTFIVLPQALRLVIPATVGQFISLFKDTSLVGIAGLLELLYIGEAVVSQPKWLGLQKEVYVFVAVIYFIFSYAMSYASQRLETALGVGEQ